MEKSNIVSVIIPTRNRQEYAYNSVKSILALNKDIQIVVTDNSDDMSLKNMLEKLHVGKTLIYKYISERIATVDNYEEAAGLASGQYFLALGDDDSILPNIIECALWMKRNNIDAVLPSKKLGYWWPNESNKKWENGYLWIGQTTDDVSMIDPEKEIIKLLQNGGQNYLSLSIACTYHGLVSKATLDKVKDATGRYYGGLSPDMYSACCISLLPNLRLAKIGFPISLPGVCPVSASADSANHRHAGRLNDAPHFIGLRSKYHWDSIIPEFFSVETIWAETMIHAIKAMHRDDLIEDYFNEKAMLSQFLQKNISLLDEINEEVNDHFKNLIDSFDMIELSKKEKRSITTDIEKKLSFEYKLICDEEFRSRRCKNIMLACEYSTKFLSSKKNLERWNSIMMTDC